ncbi:hypothetical protein ABIA33_003191 [Streptacidiphilus sp. MAP12-16]|uniref:hypothetical protein n=1 Tax=Streptacidiphilus sp. MAP12-16 TaxID=3156300 RepID=UPI0035182730
MAVVDTDAANDGDPGGLFASYLGTKARRPERDFTAFRAGEIVLPGGVLVPWDPAGPAGPAAPESDATVGLPAGRYPVWLRVEEDRRGDNQVVLVVVPFGAKPATSWADEQGGRRGGAGLIRSGLLCLGTDGTSLRLGERMLALARPEIDRRGWREPDVGELCDKALAGTEPIEPVPGAFRKGWHVLADPGTGGEAVGLLTGARFGRQVVGHDDRGAPAAYVLDLTV